MLNLRVRYVGGTGILLFFSTFRLFSSISLFSLFFLVAEKMIQSEISPLDGVPE